jgi:hypothetical protein
MKIIALALALAFLMPCVTSEPRRSDCTPDFVALKSYCKDGAVWDIVSIDLIPDWTKNQNRATDQNRCWYTPESIPIEVRQALNRNYNHP